MENAVKRKPEISSMNVLLCLLVIFIHVSSAPVTAYNRSGPLFAAVFFPWRFAGFVVPGFIFLAGLRLFLSKGSGTDYGKFYLNRFKKIVLPYIAWNVIYVAYFILMGYTSVSFSSLGGYLLRGDLISPFYFIIVILQFYALAPLWFFAVKKLHKPAAMTAALVVAAAVTLLLDMYTPELIGMAVPGAAFPYKDRVLTTYLFYWLAGCFAGAHYEQANAWLYRHRRLITVPFAVFAFLDGILGYLYFTGRFNFLGLEGVHFLFCASAVFFFFTVFNARYREKSQQSRLVKEIDSASYAIFLSHCLVLFVTDRIMHNIGLSSVSLSYAVRTVTVYAVTLFLCVLWMRAATTAKSAAGHKRKITV